MPEAIQTDKYPKYSQRRFQVEEEKPERIKIWMGVCLVLTAGFIDFVQFILTVLGIGLVLNPPISVATAFFFWLWLKLLNVSFITSPKRLATMIVQSGAELIPAANALPIWTIGTIITVLLTRAEDKGGIIGKTANMAAGGLKKVA